MKPCLLVFLLFLSSFFIACGGSSSGTIPPPPAMYNIGGTVSGLSGSGLVLQDNGGNNLPVTVNGSFTFTKQLSAGAAYAVSVLSQPSTPAQTCTVTGGSGTATANVTTIQVACTTNVVTYTIGGSVSGLSGAGLVLQNNGGDNLTVESNGAFTFATPIASGAAYAVTVLTQPSNPAQTCTVTNGSGTAIANVTNVQVTCANNVVTYTIGGTVSGLSGSGLVLQNNGANDLSISANGPFTFTTPLTSGSTYAVTVLTQPSSPVQTCSVTNGSGTATANVTTVQVTCTTSVATNEWTWIGGSNVVNQVGVYGTEGTGAPGNVPGARDSSMTWTDSSGTFWLFGGSGLAGYFNDLWKYSSGEWTWINGSDMPNQPGTYGTLGTSNPANVPGARSEAVTWLDASGNLWLFGGKGLDSTANLGDLNDLWEYRSGQWTWMGGSNLVNQVGVYGTKGTAAPTNIPGSRQHAFNWIDKSGNFWLFGGVGYDWQGNDSVLNDLWEYSNGLWTWVNGPNVINTPGTYGTKGQAATTNIPGARSTGASWIDSSGNLWLFGGGGFDSAGTMIGYLNDLWEFSNGEWIWMGGPHLIDQNPVYGTEGTAAATNNPGGRIQSVGWTDAQGNFWLFGGLGIDASGSQNDQLNDLWKYSGGEWTWVNGSEIGGQAGVYGTLGVPAATNVPGARQATVVWIDASGDFWFFAGNGYDSTGISNELNDLWEYEPPAVSSDQRMSEPSTPQR